MVQTKSKNNRTEQDDEEGLFTPVITGGDEATENTDTEQLPNEAEGGEGVFTQYMEKMTPRGSPDTVKQMLAMILSALLGAIIMILILGGRKTYNITEQVVAPPSASTNDNVGLRNTTSEEYQLTFSDPNNRYNNYALSDKEFETACVKLRQVTAMFVGSMIFDLYAADYPVIAVDQVKTVAVGLCTHDGGSSVTTRYQTTITFAADSLYIPSYFELSINLMDFFTDPKSLAAYQSYVREELSDISFFRSVVTAGNTYAPSFKLYSFVN